MMAIVNPSLKLLPRSDLNFTSPQRSSVSQSGECFLEIGIQEEENPLPFQ
jgi:hypothetical protein